MTLKSIFRVSKDHINVRIPHSGSKAKHKRDTRNTFLQDAHVYAVLLGPHIEIRAVEGTWGHVSASCGPSG